MKPEDAFIGVVEFFSTLVPGAVLAYVLIPHLHPPAGWSVFPADSVAGWAVFLVSAYVLGHIVNAVAGAVLDKHVYDRYYVPFKRAQLEQGSRSGWKAILRKKGDGERRAPDDPLLAAAKQLKREQLKAFAARADLEPLSISNAFWWALTIVSLQAPQGVHDVNREIAQSKLFRALSIVSPIAVLSWSGSMDAHRRFGVTLTSAVAAILTSLFCLWNFCRLRWGAGERAYEYFIALSCVGPEKSSPPVRAAE